MIDEKKLISCINVRREQSKGRYTDPGALLIYNDALDDIVSNIKGIVLDEKREKEIQEDREYLLRDLLNHYEHISHVTTDRIIHKKY